jgi:hypothetical protein
MQLLREECNQNCEEKSNFSNLEWRILGFNGVKAINATRYNSWSPLPDAPLAPIKADQHPQPPPPLFSSLVTP